MRVLLSIFAFLIGATIGRARGGRFRALASVQLHRAGFLAAGLAAVLIVSVIGPSRPIIWMLGAYVFFAIFGLRNLHLTGMVVLLIGLLMNLAPMVANGAVPVSEQALISVGAVDESGQAQLDPIRESDQTATSFTIFGDIVPVPIFNVVVSLGDLVIAVALADIAMNVLLRSRPRRPDEAAFSYADDREETTEIDLTRAEVPAVSSTAPSGKKGKPAHSSRRRARRPIHAIHVPAHAALHAKPSLDEGAEKLDAAPTWDAPPPPVQEVLAKESVLVLNDHAQPEGYVVESPAVDLRPIIDLTTSPSDEQLLEFLRRRAEADTQAAGGEAIRLDETPRPARRRGRRRQSHSVDA